MRNRYLAFVRKLYAVNRNLIKQKIRGRKIVVRRDVDYRTLPQLVHEEVRCCFVLSTGRCGTKFLTKLLELSKEVWCEHVPPLELAYFSKLAYEAYRKDGREAREKFRLAIDMARYEPLQGVFLTGRVYVETNNRITFFAPFLAEAYTRSKFIHLVRHPGSFVRSGVRREWYSGKRPSDIGRIVPIDGSGLDWDGMTQIEKIAWLWNETNQFVEDFKLELDADRIMFVRSEDLFSKPETTLKIFEFLQLEPPHRERISKRISRPVNVQRKGAFPSYDEWSPEQKEQLKRYATLAPKYGYDL